MFRQEVELCTGTYDIIVEFKGYRTHRGMQNYASHTYHEKMDPDFVAMAVQPDVRTVGGSKRLVWLRFEILYCFDEYAPRHIWHECYHLVSYLHRMLDAFRPQTSKVSYELDNEEFVANFSGFFFKEVAEHIIPEIGKENQRIRRVRNGKDNGRS